MNISVFGLGKLGCTHMVCMADKGYNVIGVDINPATVDAINAGKSPIYEPGVAELITANRERIRATFDAAEAVRNSDVSFVIVPTPSVEDGSFTTVYVEEVAAEIGSILQNKKSYHTIVISSTVLPGDMQHIKEFIEKTSGKKCPDNFGLCYNPDFIALGTVVRNLKNPDMILIGESDPESGQCVEDILSAMADNSPVVHRMNFENAELTKIAVNAYCTLKITFANSIAEICENMPGGDADAVTGALGSDSRIGAKYIKGGLSYGGPCFPRDNRAFAHAAEKFGCRHPQAALTDQLNNYQRNERIPKRIKSLLEELDSHRLAVLGLTYKPDTTLTEESAPVAIIKKLLRSGIDITVYDPAGMDDAKETRKLGRKVKFANSVKDCISEQSLVFIGTAWQEFCDMTADSFSDAMTDNPVVFDACGIYDFPAGAGVQLIRIGKNE